MAALPVPSLFQTKSFLASCRELVMVCCPDAPPSGLNHSSPQRGLQLSHSAEQLKGASLLKVPLRKEAGRGRPISNNWSVWGMKGCFWRTTPTWELPVRLPEDFVGTSSQLYFSLRAILPPTLPSPPQVSSWGHAPGNFLYSTLQLWACFPGTLFFSNLQSCFLNLEISCQFLMFKEFQMKYHY